MAVEIVVGSVRELAEGIWQTEIEPREVRTFGTGGSSVGERSVLLVDAQAYDRDKAALRFNLGDIHLLNVGRSPATIILGHENQGVSRPARPDPWSAEGESAVVRYGTGDHQFLQALTELPDAVRQAGEAILAGVRRHFPGDLIRRSHRRFQETPDNFWFVAVQPRDRSLSITVRGLPDRFSVSRLKLVRDRPPYSRFKVTELDDVGEAVSVILSAIRKR